MTQITCKSLPYALYSTKMTLFHVLVCFSPIENGEQNLSLSLMKLHQHILPGPHSQDQSCVTVKHESRVQLLVGTCISEVSHSLT